MIPFQPASMPPVGKMMMFIDGENLVCRYQKMRDEGWTPVPEVQHKPDVFVWRDGVPDVGDHVVIRATYYTYIQGAEGAIDATSAEIKKLQTSNLVRHNMRQPLLHPSNVTPCVFRKGKGEKAKGVDIQMTVDILTHAYQNNCDTIHILTGDGDYAPVLREAQRLGKQVFLSAFSSGLSPSLRLIADRFRCLDESYFSEAVQGNTPAGLSQHRLDQLRSASPF